MLCQLHFPHTGPHSLQTTLNQLPHYLISSSMRTFLRMITKSKFNSHSEPLFRELSILKVEHIFQMQCLKLYYNVINERTPDFFLKCLN